MPSNWSEPSATAALGIVHNGYFESMNILEPYFLQAVTAECKAQPTQGVGRSTHLG